MVGFVLGLVVIAVYVRVASSSTPPNALAVLLAGLGMGVAGLVTGQIFRTTVGILAMWAMLGALVAAIVTAIQGHWLLATAFGVHVVVLWALQQLLARQMVDGAAQGTRRRSPRRELVDL